MLEDANWREAYVKDATFHGAEGAPNLSDKRQTKKSRLNAEAEK